MSGLVTRERAILLPDEVGNLSFNTCAFDKDVVYAKGYWIDRIMHNDGRQEMRGEEYNTIVTQIGKAAAALFKGAVQSATDGRINYWAMGEGDITTYPNWDESNFPTTAVQAARTTLFKELTSNSRKIVNTSDMVYLSDTGNQGNNLSGTGTTRTNIIRVRVTIATTECNGKWREFGLFCGNSSARDGGTMINHKAHAIITKTTEMTVERTMIFTFN